MNLLQLKSGLLLLDVDTLLELAEVDLQVSARHDFDKNNPEHKKQLADLIMVHHQAIREKLEELIYDHSDACDGCAEMFATGELDGGKCVDCLSKEERDEEYVRQRFSITINFSGHLDMIPGWGYSENLWAQMVTQAFNLSTSYRTEAVVLSSSDLHQTMGGRMDPQIDWRTDVDALLDMPETDEIQFKTSTGTHLDWVALYQMGIDHPLRDGGKPDAITAYRTQAPENNESMEVLDRVMRNLTEAVKRFNKASPSAQDMKMLTYYLEEVQDDVGLLDNVMSKAMLARKVKEEA